MDFLVLFLGFLIGIVSGVLSGALGIGGATIKIPLVRVFLNLSGHMAVATCLPLTLPSAVTGALVYHKHGLIRYRTALIAGFVGAVVAVLSALLTKYFSGEFLMIALGFALILIAFFSYSQKQQNKNWKEQKRSHRDFYSAVIGAIGGFSSGFLGIGGGVLLVPLLVRLRLLPYKRAIPTSLAIMVVYTIPASLTHFALGNIDLALMAVLFVGTVIGAHFGALKVAVARECTLRQCFSGVLAFLGLLLIAREFGLLPGFSP